MVEEFSRLISELRKKSGLSQRQVADDLQISQALLSHYENGLREPKFEFVVKICDYYNVSADYLMGRTGIALNPASSTEAMYSYKEGTRSIWENGIIIELLGNISSLFAELYEEKREIEADYVRKCVEIAVYKLIRYLYEFEVDVEVMPSCSYGPMCDAALKLNEAGLAAVCEDSLKQCKTMQSESLIQWIDKIDEMIMDTLKKGE
jgi:transcriptional regulator with XRE-family HTH domain